MKLTPEEQQLYKNVRDLVKENTGWDYKIVHLWFNQYHGDLPRTPIYMVTDGRTQELLSWLNNEIAAGKELTVAEPYRPTNKYPVSYST